MAASRALKEDTRCSHPTRKAAKGKPVTSGGRSGNMGTSNTNSTTKKVSNAKPNYPQWDFKSGPGKPLK